MEGASFYEKAGRKQDFDMKNSLLPKSLIEEGLQLTYVGTATKEDISKQMKHDKQMLEDIYESYEKIKKRLNKDKDKILIEKIEKQMEHYRNDIKNCEECLMNFQVDFFRASDVENVFNEFAEKTNEKRLEGSLEMKNCAKGVKNVLKRITSNRNLVRISNDEVAAIINAGKEITLKPKKNAKPKSALIFFECTPKTPLQDTMDMKKKAIGKMPRKASILWGVNIDKNRKKTKMNVLYVY